MQPKWAQPLFEKRHCSICKTGSVFFEKLDKWTDREEFDNDIVFVVDTYAMKCYCKECFEDCGGFAIVDGLMEDDYGTE